MKNYEGYLLYRCPGTHKVNYTIVPEHRNKEHRNIRNELVRIVKVICYIVVRIHIK